MKQKKKILIVDDNEAHRMMLKANLSKEGYDLYEADDLTDDQCCLLT